MHIAAHAFLGPAISDRMRTGFFAEFRRFSAGLDPVWPGWLPLPHLVRSRRARDRLRALVFALIEERRNAPVDPPDFLQLLSEARFEDGEEVPDLVLVNLVLMLIWAGHETTTGHISWALVDLLQHPAELATVLAEQHAVLDGTDATEDADGLTLTAVRRLEALDRALHETERLHPVAFMLARHASDAFELDGYRIPKGAMILTSPSVAHRLPAEYPDPDEYRPDRYLDNPRAAQNLIGFGGGTHRCLGVHFAYLEMKVVLTLLLHRYRFELVDLDPQPVPGNKTKWPNSPCRVRYQPRS
jgi:sterol 14alpha-demethylase